MTSRMMPCKKCDQHHERTAYCLPPVAPPPASPEPIPYQEHDSNCGCPECWGRPEFQKPASPEPMPEGWRVSDQGCWLQDDAGTYACMTPEALRVNFGSLVSRVPLPVLRALLATQGLRVVPESERLPAPFTVRMVREHGFKLVSPESAKVLEACALLTESDLVELNHQTLRRGAVAEAELARRGR